eukprot:CAMPEP_0174700292 /NCGR_PEP_ID=MMETSP1094-20130205/5289_1 /TAXON_ID=156173 /ORGANISM="Chrysochromulina brevifilum, Strain UTEX LB 985" /LENGTH=100 /DNA_ID=CAMNT_0015897747 /DNA_START=680 /DNA_END=981 /DNA_ORIENTATION=+
MRLAHTPIAAAGQSEASWHAATWVSAATAGKAQPPVRMRIVLARPLLREGLANQQPHHLELVKVLAAQLLEQALKLLVLVISLTASAASSTRAESIDEDV